MVLAYTKLSFNFCHSKIIRENRDTEQVLDLLRLKIKYCQDKKKEAAGQKPQPPKEQRAKRSADTEKR